MTQIPMIPSITPPREKSRSHANRGRWLEEYCAWTHAVYLRDGLARIDRNYPESKQLRADGWARVIGKGVCDYSGVIAGGRAVAFDAKECGRKSIPLDALKEHQLEHLRDVERLGGIAFVLVAFCKERVYAVPAKRWIQQAEAAEAWRWGQEKPTRLSLREKDMPDTWKVPIGGRGVDWLATVGAWNGL